MIAATQFISENIYSLKREYGFSLTIFKKVSSTIDIESGAVSDTIRFRYINKAILLPSTLIRKIFKVEYDIVSRIVLIDAKDVIGFNIKKNDFIVFDGRKYLVNRVKTYDYNAAFLLEVKESLGSDVSENFEVKNTIAFNQSTTVEIV